MKNTYYKRSTLDARLLYQTVNRMIESSIESPNDSPEFRRGIVTLVEQLVADGTLEYDGFQFISTGKGSDKWVRHYEIPSPGSIPSGDVVKEETPAAEVEEAPAAEAETTEPEPAKKRRGRPPGSKNKPKPQMVQ